MLTANVVVAPRPRPPAKTRRASAQIKSSPPPPYAVKALADHSQNDPRRDILLGSPISATNSLIGAWGARSSVGLPLHPEDWSNERSREELAELLVKADGLIKERENELNMTTEVCRSLYENNLELKNKHKALLARLPVSPASFSPPGSSNPSPISPTSSLPHSPHYYCTDLPRLSSKSNLTAPRIRHHRRISVSPSDLATLSDQNAELLSKLEKLESESVQADQAGRRKLRNLEKEIQGLRDELDETRARSDELEQKARLSGVAKRDSEEAQRRRLEREEKFRALRGKSEGDNCEEVRDFAPGSALAVSASLGDVLGIGRPRNSPNVKSPSPSKRRYVSEAAFFSPTSSEGANNGRIGETLASSSMLPRSVSQPGQFPISTPPSTHEYALVSQLLLKIRELEEINVQISEQQAHTTAQLQSVQMDAASIRLVYESLGDTDDVQWLVDEGRAISSDVEIEDPDDDDDGDHTITFTNLRRSLDHERESSVEQGASLGFAEGINADMQSSLRHAIVPNIVPVNAHNRARKSVVGLFDSPHGQLFGPVPGSPLDETESVRSLALSGLPPVPFSEDFDNAPTTPSLDPYSPPLNLPLSSDQETEVLQPNLASELGEGWGARTENHHFRSSSLFNLTLITPAPSNNDDVSVPGSFTDIPLLLSQQTSSSSSDSSHLQPGTWHGDPQFSASNTSQESVAEKKRRKSQTIRMRTNHWNEGRFGGTLLSSERSGRVDIERPSTPIPERLSNAFDAVVHTISRGQRDSLDSPHSDVAPPRNEKQRNHRGIVAFVLEIWLWLQFVIIVVVFLWAMAKRGPKNVLENAEKRKRR
ncbi:hypothetical protein BJ138DRAFT_1089561 [Hygrophoropsis aurantiaca]|uniref:Uncharacterized protein n=1 Tax=Hygrophoropsis aurantiaca TaxID=72124 RepID=A0ACB8A8J1_9AGAM|nr:hypothetical protein BJ138DRAFT_1089561 [Hygrophoropsis aurantiaca]